MRKKLFTFLLALVASVGLMNAKVTWNSSNISNFYVEGTDESYSQEGVTLSVNADNNAVYWYHSGGDESKYGILFYIDETGGYTFSNTLGKNFTKIEMFPISPIGWTGVNLGSGWSFSGENGDPVTWNGNASTVDLLNDVSQFNGENVKSIVFYFEGDSEEPATPVSPVTAARFVYNYDCQRSPSYPKKETACTLSGFKDPLEGYKGKSNGNIALGPWKLEFVAYYTPSNNYGCASQVNTAVYQYYMNLSSQEREAKKLEMPIFRLWQYNLTAREYQPAAYGVVCAYASEGNTQDHGALFISSNSYGCFLSGHQHTTSFALTCENDLTTGLTALVDAASASDPYYDVVWPVIVSIDAIGPVELSEHCKYYIEGSRAAYNALTDEQKAQVTNYSTLTDAETQWAALAAVAQPYADAVIDLINAIPNPVVYTQQCKDAIDAAQDAYDALTDGQKVLVTNAETLKNAPSDFINAAHPNILFTADNSNIKRIEDVTLPKTFTAGYFSTDNELLGILKELYGINDNAYINFIYSSNKAVTTSGNVLTVNPFSGTATVSGNIVIMSTSNDSPYSVDITLELPPFGPAPAVDPAVQNVIDLINAIPNPVVYNQECFNALNAVYDAYVALSEEQRDQVTNYDDYVAAEERYYMLGSVNYVIEKINEIGNVEFTSECKHRIDYARSEYCNLTLEAKGYVTNYNTLLAAEAAYAALIPVSSTVVWDEAILETIDADEWGEATYTNGSLSLKAVDGRARYIDDEEHFLFDGSNSEKSFVFSCTSANMLCIEITVSEKHEHNELSCAWQETATGYRWVGEATSVDLASTIFKVTGIRFSLGEAFPEPTPTPAQDGDKLPGAFSVDDGKVVYFSKGNLQYLGNIDRWHFAENQWTIIGNAQASDSRDLFSWGTGDNPDSEDYSTYTEWGNNIEGNWRTLTVDEWTYLFNTRTDASSKYGTSTVAGVVGLILLPDVYDGTAINTERTAWDNNVISSSAWAAYEAAGAVFLPAAGLSDAFGVYGVGEQGFYWSSTMDALSHDAISVFYGFDNWEGYWFNQVDAQFQPQEGHSVRLVSETAPTPASTPNSIVINGTPAVGDNSISLTYYFDPDNVPGIYYYAPTLKVKCAADNKWDEKSLSLSEISSGTTTITLTELGSFQEGKSYDVCFAYFNGNWVDDVFQSFSFPAPTPTTAVVIGDPNDASQVETFLTTYNGQTIDELIIDRPVLNNMYNTLCLPFDMNAAQIAASSLNGVEIYEFIDADVTNDELYLYTSEQKHEIVAGRPYLVKFSAASQLDELNFIDVVINNADLDNQAVTIKGVTFKGTFQPIVLGAQEGLNFNGGHLFLMANNTLMWPNTNNPLKPFRAYFTVNVDAGQSAGMPVRRGMPAHIGGPAQIPTGVDQISQEPGQTCNSQKLIENGVLYIIKNGVKYNAQGQIVK